jgi:hypothetical protein
VRASGRFAVQKVKARRADDVLALFPALPLATLSLKSVEILLFFGDDRRPAGDPPLLG